MFFVFNACFCSFYVQRCHFLALFSSKIWILRYGIFGRLYTISELFYDSFIFFVSIDLLNLGAELGIKVIALEDIEVGAASPRACACEAGMELTMAYLPVAQILKAKAKSRGHSLMLAAIWSVMASCREPLALA